MQILTDQHGNIRAAILHEESSGDGGPDIVKMVAQEGEEIHEVDPPEGLLEQEKIPDLTEYLIVTTAGQARIVKRDG